MKKQLTPASLSLGKTVPTDIRNVLKLIGMKEVAANVFSLPTKNKS